MKSKTMNLVSQLIFPCYFLAFFCCFDREIRLGNEITKKRSSNTSSGVAINTLNAAL